MKPVVYDAGVLVAADRNDRRRWAERRVRLEAGVLPLVPAAVVAQVSRAPRQAELHRFLRGCEIAPLDEACAHRVGALLGRARTTDVADASVVELAIRTQATILTGDAKDIGQLVAVEQAEIEILAL
jgi:hypothetical protein